MICINTIFTIGITQIERTPKLKKKFFRTHNIRVIKKLRNFKILQRLIISFIVICLVPLMVAGLYSYSQSSSEIRSKLGAYSEEIVSQVQKNLSSRFFKIRNDSIDITLNTEVQEFMKIYDTSFPSVRTRKQNDIMQIFTNKFSFSADVDDILLISPSGNINYTYSNQGKKLYLTETCINNLIRKLEKESSCWYVLTADSCYRKSDTYGIDDEVGKYSLMESNETSVLFCIPIKTFLGEKIGYLVVNTKQNLINNIFKDTTVGTNAEISMVDEKRMVVSTNHETIPIAEIYPDRKLCRNLETNLYSNSENGTFDLNTGFFKSDMVVYSKLEGVNDWYVLCRIPSDYLNNESMNIGFSILVMMAVSLLVALIFSFEISSSIMVPLKRMIKVIDVVKNGNLEVKIHDDGADELAIVANSFDSMTDEVNNLIQTIKENEKKKGQLEFESLQSQINPHFISNTLNSVAWLAQIQKADNIVTIVNSLTYLLNESMHRGDGMIQIAEEISYIEKYLTIQQYRFVSEISFECQIPEKIQKCMIPKFTIEPLVENSIVHGLSPDKNGIHIVIKANEIDGDIEISVIDDGVGFQNATVKRPLNESVLGKENSNRQKRFHGIGLKNVDDRLKLYYGPQYGISVFSIPENFSILSILIPYRPYSDGEDTKSRG